MYSIRTRSLVTIGATIASLAGAVVTAPAMASIPVRIVADTPQTTVNYADIDLHSAAGQRALQHRVNMAVNAVCSPVDDVNHFAFDRCRANARANVRAQLAEQNVSSAGM